MRESNNSYAMTKHYMDKHPDIDRKVGKPSKMKMIDSSRGPN